MSKTTHHLLSHVLVVLATAFATAAAPPAVAVDTEDLPDIGAPWDSLLSRSEEDQIGRMIVYQLREADQLLDDPELSEYIQTIGHRLSGHAESRAQRFEFFMVRDPTINAFALPGGYIGVNTGLLLTTENESELAGVLAHEISHVTQRHIVRGLQKQGQTTLATTAGIIAAILLGATGGLSDDAVQAALAVAQGLSVQKQIDFTRAHEREADRVGVGVLYQAGFDPLGMPTFFEKMGQAQQPQPGARVPAHAPGHDRPHRRDPRTRRRRSVTWRRTTATTMASCASGCGRSSPTRPRRRSRTSCG